VRVDGDVLKRARCPWHGRGLRSPSGGRTMALKGRCQPSLQGGLLSLRSRHSQTYAAKEIQEIPPAWSFGSQSSASKTGS